MLLSSVIFYVSRVVQITLEEILKPVCFSFALRCQLQMKERTKVLVENMDVIVLLMARLWKPTRLIQLKGYFFFLAAKTIQRFILLVSPYSDTFLSDVICYFSVFMMSKKKLL